MSIALPGMPLPIKINSPSFRIEISDNDASDTRIPSKIIFLVSH